MILQMLQSNFWDFQIRSIDLYHWLAWFFVYSFFGWIWETSFVSIKSKRFVNRGFVMGPCLTIYGSGAVIIYMTLLPFGNNNILLFLLGLVLATVLEYVTAVVMEGVFHTSWWDYSKSFCNFQGRICLFSSLFWGVLTIVLFRFLQPFVQWLVNLVPRNTGISLVMAVSGLYMVDFTFACIGAADIAGKLEHMNEALEEFVGTVKTSKIGLSAEELMQRMHKYRGALTEKRAMQLLKNSEQALKKHLANVPGDAVEVKDAAMERFQKFRQKYLSAHSQTNWFERRILRNYPNLGRGTKARQEKRLQKKAKKNS